MAGGQLPRPLRLIRPCGPHLSHVAAAEGGRAGQHIELPGGFDYTGAQFDAWARKAGFERTEIRALVGPTSAAIADKA